MNLVLWAIEHHRPRAVVLCFGAEAAVYRKELYPPYHADRPEMPPELARQWADADDFFGAFGWGVESHDTLEADDLLGSYAAAESDAGGTALLFTGDRDMFQCVSDQVQVLFPRGGKDGPELIGPAEVQEALRRRSRAGAGLHRAARRPDRTGCPGAKGIGEKTAKDLLREHGSLEGTIAASVRLRPRIGAALRESAEELLAFREIATLVHVPVERPARPRHRLALRSGRGARAAACAAWPNGSRSWRRRTVLKSECRSPCAA